jgi:gliding motility-associated-like protein
MKKSLLSFLIVFHLSVSTFAQFNAVITPSATASQIASKFAGNGVAISNVVLNCPNGASGIFNASSTTLGLDSGIVLTTGSVLTNVAGTLINYGINSPASAYAKVDNLTIGGDADLATSAGVAQSVLHDVCKIEFDFVPLGDTLNFRYKFASEEYPDFICSPFTDIFGIYISGGPGFTIPTNIALIPGTTIPVSVNSVNNGVPTAFFNIATCNAIGAGSPFTNYYVDNMASTNIVYNGMTVMMNAQAIVTPCSTYHMKIAISDLNDGDRDSGIFLEASSLKSQVAIIDSIKNTNTVTLSTPFVIEGCNPDTIFISRPNPKPTPLLVAITTSGSATFGTDFTCPTSVTIPANGTSATFLLSAILDNINEGTETIKLYIYGSPCGTYITDSAVISLLDYPLYNLSANDTICTGQSTTLIANNITSSPYLNFTWNPGSVNANSITVSPTVNSIYTCTAKYPGCPNRDSIVNITVSPLPMVNAGIDKSICNNSPTQLAGTVSNYLPYNIAYQWTPTAGLNNSIVINPIATPSGTTNYTLTATNSAGCSASDAIQVTVAPALIINTNVTNVGCNGTNTGGVLASVTGAFGTTTYSVNPSSATNTTGNFANLLAGTYTVSASNSIGCTSTTIITITQSNALFINTPIFAPPLCNGGNTGSINVSASGGNGALIYTKNPSGQTSATGVFGAVSAGTYTLVATDANGCTITTSIIVAQPSAVVWSAVNKTNVLCNGANNGTISTTVSGGTPSYLYTILPGGANNTSGNFNNLTPATYTITGSDANGCTTSTTIIITAPISIVINAPIKTNPTCVPGNNGSISISATNGSGAFSYNINPGGINNTTGIFSILGIGAYIITATDANGCTKSTTVNLAFSNAPNVASLTSVGVSCFGNTNGTITATTSGGAGIITYTLLPNNINNTTGNFSGIATGNYSVSIVDASGCTSFSAITVSTPALLNFNSFTATNPLCNASGNGNISATMIGGTAVYTYVLTPGSITNTNGNFSGLTNGNYTINVTDSKGCTKSTTATLLNPPPIVWNNNNTQTNVICNGASTGIIGGTAIGGTSTISYTVNPIGTINSTGNFTGISAGTYTIIAKDANNCSITRTVIITQNPLLIINTISTTTASCIPNNDGAVSFGASGGIASYSYTLNGSTNATNTTGIFSPLASGIYTITVQDALGCTKTSTKIINNATGPIITNVLYLYPQICIPDSSDSVKVIATGLGILNYTLSPGNITNTTGFFAGLLSGNYAVTVTDASGCIAVTNFNIMLPDSLQLNIVSSTIPLCIGTNIGNISLSTNGGTSPFTFTNLTTAISNFTGIFNNLPIGTYNLKVVDSNGCADTVLFNVPLPPVLIFDSIIKINLVCNNINTGLIHAYAHGGTAPLQYQLLPGNILSTTGIYTGLFAGTYTILVVDASGCSVSSTTILTQPPGINFTSVTSTSPTCTNPTSGSYTISASGGVGSITYSLNTANNSIGIFTTISAGNYTIIATDASGCTKSSTSILAIPSGPTATYVVTNVTCNNLSNGGFVVTANGGQSPYTYSFNGGAFTSINNYNSLAGGVYTITIKDALLCSITYNIYVLNPNIFNLSTPIITNILCNGINNGAFFATASGGTGIVSYLANPGGISNFSGSFPNLFANTYTLTATDANGCATSKTAIITQPLLLVINTPTYVSPTCIPNNNGTMTITASGGTGSKTYTLSNAGTNATGIFNGLIAGIYTITVIDGNNCIKTSTFNLPTLNAPTFTSVTHSNVLCNGGATGTINAIAVGGTGALTYSIMPTNITNTSGLFNTLQSAVYTVNVMDANGCSNSSLINITQPVQFFLSINNITNALCNNINTGSINITSSGGVGVINYNLQPINITNTSGTFSNLASNLYTINATDANSCAVSSVVNITTPNAIIWNSFFTANNNCYLQSNGTINAYATGGTGSVSYLLNPGGITSSNGAFTNLSANTYTVNATDANGCIVTSTTIITQPASGITFSNITNSIPSCIPGNDATITVSATGGTGTINYTIGGVSNINGFFTNIGSATFIITATDANNCTTTSSVMVSNPNSPNGNNNTIVNNTCFGGSNGSISIVPTNGLGPIQCTLQPGSISNFNGLFTGLTAQTYSITLIDSVGCSSSLSLIVGQPNAILFNTNIVSSAVCFGGTGDLNVLASGGTGAFSYNLLPNNLTNNTGTFLALPATTYTMVGTDANNCSNTTLVSITTPPALYFSAFNPSNVSCYGGTNGFIACIVRGGTGGITYTVNPGNIVDTTGIYLNLPSATYTIIATDANGCTIDTVYTITQPAILNFSALVNTIPTCVPGNDAIISATAIGGTLAYQYKINTNAYVASGVFVNLGASTYTISVKDAKNCTYTQTIVVTIPGAPVFNAPTVAMPLCFGNNNGNISATASGGTGALTYVLNPSNVTNNSGSFTNLIAQNYTVSVTDIALCNATTLIVITQPNLLQFTTSIGKNPLCYNTNTGVLYHKTSGGTGIVNIVIQPGSITTTADSTIAIGANNYTLVATDANGCSTTTFINIINPTQLVFTNFSKTNVSCFNGNNGTISALANGGTGILNYTINPGGITNTNGLFNTLIANTNYSINVVDANGCSIATNTTLTQPPLITMSYTNILPATCLPGGDGAVTVVASGGTGSFNYTILPQNINNNTGTFINLNNTTYTIYAIDANACSITGSFTLTTPNSPIISSLIGLPASCNPNNNGSIIITATNGTTPYLYQLNITSYSSNATINNLIANTYTATVKDANGCTATSTVNINTTVGVIIDSTSFSNINCFGNANGIITIFAGTGSIPYTYTLNPGSITNTTNVFNSLSPNIYTVNVVDDNGCTTVTNITITQPNLLLFNPVSKIIPSCFGGANGTISVSTNGGTNPVSFSILPNNTQATVGNFSGLLGNASYTIIATDSKNCTTSTIVFLTQPTAVSITNTAHTDVTCNGSANATISILAIGGTGIKTYSIVPNPNSNTTGNFTNLPGNTYTITIADANNCSITSSVFVYEPPAITIVNHVNTPVTCFGFGNGIDTLKCIGGVGILTYKLMPLNIINTTGIFTNLSANTYTISITDTNNCSIITTTTIVQPAILKIDSNTISNIICNGGNNGTLQLYISGGNGANNFSILPAVLPNNVIGIFSPLAPAIYTLSVIDNKGCSTSTSLSITQPPAMNLVLDTLRNLTCNSTNNGYIYTNVTGGLSPYFYTILPQNGSNSSGDFFNLSIGNYTIFVTDYNGCNDSLPNLIITQPPAIVIDSIIKKDVICYSLNTGSIDVFASGGASGTFTYTLLPNNITNTNGSFDSLNSSTYTITILDAGGCTISTSLFLDQKAELILINQLPTPPICFGESNGSISFSPTGGVPPYLFSINNGPFSADTFYNNLPTGNYYIYIKDSKLCTNDTSIYIAQPDSLQLFINETKDLYCFPVKTGEIKASAIGGNNGAYTFICLPINKINNDGNFTNLSKGIYTIEVRDSLGCKTQQIAELGVSLNKIILEIKTTPISCNSNGADATATATVKNGIEPYQYNWSNPDNDTGFIADSLTFGSYFVTITDSAGCIISDTFSIEPSSCCKLWMPNAFTPNNDSKNDTYHPEIGGSITNIYYAIYDRWGNKVYSSIDVNRGWDGTYKGQPMDVETYFYIITYNCALEKTAQKQKGDFILVR